MYKSLKPLPSLFAIILSIIVVNVLTYPLDLIKKNKYNKKKEIETRKVK